MSGTGGLWMGSRYLDASGLTRYGQQAVGPGRPPANVALRLPGHSFYLGPVMPHFGHCLTETFSRWWALTPEKLAAYDWFVTPTPEHEIPPFAWQLLEMAGVRDRVYCCAGPTALEKVSLAGPANRLQDRVHWAVQHVPALFERAPRPAPDPRPLFISRRHTGLDGRARAVLGEEWIESALRANGCVVIEPETLSVQEQIDAFRRHRRIIGFAGSALHTLILAGGGQRMLAYTDRNVPPHFHMLEQALGVRSRYVACGVPRPSEVLDLQVSFRPQWIDPVPVLRACQRAGFIQDWDEKHHLEQLDNGLLTRRFNALLLLRWTQEQTSGTTPPDRARVLEWASSPMVDRRTLDEGLARSPELRGWLS
ncbi:glycosyltransferase family 61 protein [Hydrogenophaga sp.]|uniref:glycosyltransferase family 61 protein n=1 Tax=Hydrogenophaga sp. TaxID=1904254 RepID=UPI003D9BA906